MDSSRISDLLKQDRTSDNTPGGNPDSIGDLNKRLIELSDAKRALLALTLRRKANKTNARAPISRLPSQDRLPLSFSQEALWLLDQLEGNSIHYHEPVALRLYGVLELDALQKTIDAVLDRHEILRTTFSPIDGVPMQIVSRGCRLELEPIDLSQVPTRDRDRRIQEFLRQELQRPFNLFSDSMLRIKLLRVQPDEHILLIVVHHIATDGWSMGVLYRELSVLYQAFLNGEPSPLADLPIQYADFALWQRDWLKGEVLERQLSYWKKQLDGIPSVLNLPTDYPRPAVQTYRGASQSFTLSKELTDKLKELSRKEGVTLFMTLLAAFQTLLYRYTGQEDIVVGSPIANRNRQEIEDLIGFFANTVVLRTNFSADPTLKELLARVRETAVGAFTHHALPFETLVQALHPERNRSYSPLFQVMFAMQNTPQPNLSLQGLHAIPIPIELGMAKFDLTLSLHEEMEELKGFWEYNTDLFDPRTIVQMAGHFCSILDTLVTDLNQRISSLHILSEDEKRQLIVEWNDTKKAYPTDRCIHQWFEEQVENCPQSVAVSFGDQQLTYAELNTKANQLANYLRKLGVGPETLVGICVERSVDMVVGLLAIFKAGGAYVPLDPDYPKERITFIIEDTHAPVLLTKTRWLERLSDLRARVLCLDQFGDIFEQERGDNLNSQTAAGHLAYVIYTSGSTGKPKGVMSTHGGIINRLLWMQERYHLTATDRVLQKTPFTFDVSVWELFWPLMNGACLVVALPGGHQDPDYLAKLIFENKVTVLHFVPSVMQRFLETEGIERCASLRLVVCSGEALPFDLQERFFARLCIPLHNLYGPTEASVDVTSWACQAGQTRTGVPIGRPITNTQIYLLDSYLQPVVVGVPGELHIGGAPLARGYLNRPELTAEKFIPNPFSDEPGTRLYKTGDLARYLPDGNIEFLGRMDHQVKIRGFRIELGEIEAVLSQHPAVKETVVLARENAENPKLDKRLVAYVVPAGKPSCATSELRSFLKQKLPEYMIPSAFVFLDALPLTPNGKVDRKALPAPDPTRPELQERYVAPRTPVEEMVAEIWAEVLKLDAVGIHDNFFDLGGHSLLAFQLLSRVNRAFQVTLSLRTFFQNPSVAQIAELLEITRHENRRLPNLAMTTISTDADIPLSFPQQRFWFLGQLQPASPIYNVPFGFHLLGALNVEALHRSLQEVVRRHQALRTVFCVRNDQPVQVIIDERYIELPIIDLTHLPDADLGSTIQQLVRNEADRPLDLSTDSTLRASLIRLRESEHILFLTTHHIVFDHWSIGILNRELALLYNAFASGRPSRLPELHIQYKDYATWQRQLLQAADFETDLSYWKQQLNSSPPELKLPTDYPRQPVQSFRGARQSLVLPKSLVDSLRTLSREVGVTLFMILLAAFKVLLGRLAGQSDLVVGAPIAGRTRPEFENLIGLFLNTIVLRTNLSGNPSFRQLLAHVREVTLEAYDHSELPFEKLLEELQPTRSLSRTPLFQVFVNMYNFGDATLELPGLTIKPIEFPTVSYFDLTLYIRERNGATRLALVYNADLFCTERIDEMLRQYEQLLSQIVENPDRKISQLSLVTPVTKNKLPDPAVRLSAEWVGSIHKNLSDHAKRIPSKPAIIDPYHIWPYKQLNDCGNQLSRCLLASGIGREDIVAIYGERSAELVLAVLGVLKSGAAFLILDPAYPAPRLIAYVNDAKPRGFIALEGSHGIPDELTASVDTTARCRIVLPEHFSPDDNPLSKYSREDPGIPVGPDDLACVSYTSGSTGEPKGILGRHGPLSHFLPWQAEKFSLTSSDRFSLLSGLSHDPLQREMFTALWVGGTICIPDPNVFGIAGGLAQWLSEQKVTFVHLTPALGRLVTDSASPDCRCTSLRHAFFVGDKLTWTDVEALQRLAPHVNCVNYYGSTETQRAVSYFEVPPGASDVAAKPVIPVGRGMPGVQLLILNSEKGLAGIGEVGEIYLRSPHLARGYLNSDSLTNERFLINPFTGDANDRIYKTGDLGRYLPDGNAEILARADEQIKIRGFRIEPGEIEAVLSRHPAVKETVVLARENAENAQLDERLVAYIVPADKPSCAISELRSFLKQKLPEYMIPSAFVFLDALPLTPNGKVDRKALPAPDPTRPELRERYVAARTPVEEMVAEIWAEVLKLDAVGIHDNFFDLGGHSLLAVQLLARVCGRFQVELPVRSLFEAPTVAELVGLMDTVNSITQSGRNRVELKEEHEQGTL